ncbi:MAG: VWA domain-containing protein [Candidatus Cloacimonetes bacterium]|nr:VWA domain-containing protein [Candidatus Cloacimonadota bacterium]
MKKLIILASSVLFSGILLSDMDIIDSGFVFYNGTYIKAPYSVAVDDLAIEINGIRVTGQLDYRQENYFYFPYDPGYPQEIPEDFPLDKGLYLKDPHSNVPYVLAAVEYYYSYFDYENAAAQAIAYMRNLPFVKEYEKDGNGIWQIETHSGEKRHLAVTGGQFRKHNMIWGPGGEGPLGRAELDRIKAEEADLYRERLQKGDLLIFYPESTFRLYPQLQAVDVLNTLLDLFENIELSDRQKADELIALGIAPRYEPELASEFIANFQMEDQLRQRLVQLNKNILNLYGAEAIRELERDSDLKSNGRKSNWSYSDDGFRSTSFSPDDRSVYFGCGYTYESSFSLYETERNQVIAKLVDQDYDAAYTEFKDTALDGDCGTLTYENLKSMRYADFLYWTCHGHPSNESNGLFLIYMETEQQIKDWCDQDTTLITPIEVIYVPTPGDTLYPWSALASSNWPATYWSATLTQSQAISIISACFSYENGWTAACGGGVAFGYNESCTQGNNQTNNNELLGRMNGTIGDGVYRTAIAAFVHMPAHLGGFSIYPVDALITLCPKVDFYSPGDEELVAPSGTGVLQADTWVMDIVSPDQALTFVTHGDVAISNIIWDSVTRDQVNRIEYDWDGEGFFLVEVTAHHDKFNSWGINPVPFHNLDWDGIAPNTEDGKYVFESGSNIDVALCIDRSGSMEGDKITQAKNASNQFIALLRRFDALAVTSFSSSAAVNFPIEVIVDNTTKLDAQAAVNAIVANGNTSIGSGMQAAQLQLQNSPLPNYPQAMILLSDGEENTAPWVDDILPTIPDQTDIYTIGLGSDADAAQLTEIAGTTGGQYFFSPNPEDLMNIFDTIQSRVTGKQQIAAETGMIPAAGGENQHTVQIDPSVKQFHVATMWNNPAISLGLTLYDPLDNEIDPEEAETNPLVSYDAFQTIAFYKVSFPQSGIWTIKISGDPAPQSQEYAVSTTGYTDVTMEFFFGQIIYIKQDTIWAFAGLREGFTPVTGANVTAEVQVPTEREIVYREKAGEDEANYTENTLYRMDEITFYDDGNHNDNDPDDGLYGASYANTAVVGNYLFNVLAVGVAPSSGVFTRHTFRTVYVQEAPIYETTFTELDFGEIIETTSISMTISITNNAPEGAADLLMSDICSNHPYFSADQTELTVEQGQSKNLMVTYNPPVPGLHEGILSFSTNDPLHNYVEIPLSGFSLTAPDYGVTPGEINLFLSTGEKFSHAINIENFSQETPLLCALGFNTVISNIVINEIFLGTPDWIELYNGTEQPVNLLNISISWTVTHGDMNYIFLPDFTLAKDAYVVITDSSQPSDSTHLNMGGNINWSSSYGGSCRLIDTGEEIDFMRFGGSDTGSHFWIENTILPIPSSAQGKTLGRLPYSLDQNMASDWYVQYKSEAEENDAPDGRSRISWAYCLETGDTLAPQESDSILVYFDATGMHSGTYNGSLIINTNNPFNPETTVALELTVTGAPDIILSEDTVVFDSTYINVPVSSRIFVTNIGVESLEISNITTDLAVFSSYPVSLAVGVMETDTLLVTFTPDNAGTITDTLRIFSNDPDESPYRVVLQGIGVHPGQISIDPGTVEQNMPAGAEYIREIEVINTGLGELAFEVYAENVWNGRLGEIILEPVHAYVVDSWGTDYGTAAWVYLNDHFDDIYVDFTALNDYTITYEEIAATEADVLIISDAWRETQSYGEFTVDEINAIAQYINEGHGLIITAGTFNNYCVPNHNLLAPLVGLDPVQFYEWNNGSSYMGGNYSSYDLLYPEHPVLCNLSDPYVPGIIKSSVPDTRNWDDALGEARIIARSDNNEAVITVYQDRIYISNVPEDDTTADDYDLLHDAILYAGNRVVRWLHLDYGSENIPPTGTAPVYLIFDSHDLETGTYEANLKFLSNDPTAPETNIPVTLNVGEYILNPQGITLELEGNTVEISWNEVVGAVQYGIYSAADPSGPFVEETGGEFSYPEGRVVWTKEFSTLDEKRFFYVKACSE